MDAILKASNPRKIALDSKSLPKREVDTALNKKLIYRRKTPRPSRVEGPVSPRTGGDRMVICQGSF
jgi:hypothetical protein